MVDLSEEIAVEVDRETPVVHKSSAGGMLKGSNIKSFQEAVAEAVRRGPKASAAAGGGQSLWKLVNKSNGFSEKSCECPDYDAGDEDAEDQSDELKPTRFGKSTILQCVILAIMVIALPCSLLVPRLKRASLWDLRLWKWEILLLALISGSLISGGLVRVFVIFTEQNFLFRKRVLYFTYGLKRSVQNFLWLSVVLLTWYSMFDSKFNEDRSRVLSYVTEILLCAVVASLLWLLKTALVKMLALSFHVHTYFVRIHEALFHQYVIETLSFKPIAESSQGALYKEPGSSLAESLLPKADSPWKWAKIGVKSPVKNKKIQKNNESAWYMKKLMHMIQHGSLSTLDEQILESDMEDPSHVQFDADTKCRARKTARKIFLNVAKPKSRMIYLEDLMQFLTDEEAAKTIRLFGAKKGAEGVDKQALENWVIEAFEERVALARSLNDTNTAVDDLHNMLNVIVAVVIGIIMLIIFGVPVAQFLVFISSQLLLLAFVFGNSCKTVFEAIIFLFVMHPYDVGDRIEVDGIQMIVEEMNILTTVFSRSDHLKIRYPNYVLATKPISNFNRSPHMGETVDFCVHISTPMDKIHAMKMDIKQYIERETEHWYPCAEVIIKDVEDMNRIVMSVWLRHRMNHQDMGERWARRARLVERMIEIFRRHEVEYRMVPVDVNLRKLHTADDYKGPSSWVAPA